MTATIFIFGESIWVCVFVIAVFIASLLGFLLVVRLIYVNVFRGASRNAIITIGTTEGDSHERR